ncbi:myelin transcription factor 1-like protein isoform X2 [Scophthalmus maximus]|uniref:myelin transcription factor 1-like protein isoform X2 n=1 Tax=Scophthalmus maximus TaxID=52904 RepID=UPI0015E14CD1|nr:myelin transcription factor 1-like protein isoform X2 [Scophthalmus maximus]
MRIVVPVFVFLTVAVFHTALSASLQSAEKEDKVAQHDGLTELQKIDQMEFEAAQKNEATQMNVTEEPSEVVLYLEAVQDESEEERIESEDEDNTEGGGNSDAAAHEESESASSEEEEGRQRREHHEPVTETVSSLDEVGQDSTQEQGVLE